MDNQCHHCERHTVLNHRLTLIFEESTPAQETSDKRTPKLIIATIQGPVLRTMFSAGGRKDAITKAKRLIQQTKARRTKKVRAKVKVKAKVKPAPVVAGWAD